MALAGRVMLYRTGGKLCFATIRDASGDIQIMLSLDRVGADRLADWKSDVDLGDHVGVEGEVITSKRGELSVMADRFAITSKCLRPLPEKHAGLTDPEARVRQRYVDLIVNDEARKMARIRSATVRAVRDFWHEEGYLEVETPMLQPIHGGAAARPFKTHINAYDMDLYLRIAIETGLIGFVLYFAFFVWALRLAYRLTAAQDSFVAASAAGLCAALVGTAVYFTEDLFYDPIVRMQIWIVMALVAVVAQLAQDDPRMPRLAMWSRGGGERA